MFASRGQRYWRLCVVSCNVLPSSKRSHIENWGVCSHHWCEDRLPWAASRWWGKANSSFCFVFLYSIFGQWNSVYILNGDSSWFQHPICKDLQSWLRWSAWLPNGEDTLGQIPWKSTDPVTKCFEDWRCFLCPLLGWYHEQNCRRLSYLPPGAGLIKWFEILWLH